MKYCQYHDIILCPKHEDQCLGGEHCNLQTADDVIAPELMHPFCSVCSGILKPKGER